MFFLIRFFYSALLIILSILILPELNLGGRFHILFLAALSALFSQIINKYVINLPRRQRALVTATSLLISLGAAKLLFSGVKLSLTGILILYLGSVFLELLLPEDFRKVREKTKDRGN